MSRWLLAFLVLTACSGSRGTIKDVTLPTRGDGDLGEPSMPALPTKSKGSRVPVSQLHGGGGILLTIENWEDKTHTRVDEEARAKILAEMVDRPSVERPPLARTYLYELRDIKLNGGGKAETLTLTDLEKLPPQTYLAGFGPAIGWLRAGSQPEGGTISIDGVERGTTEKEFTLNTGDHNVRIIVPDQPCQEIVTIRRGKWSEVKCPK